jgi:hypothetical protein
MSFDTGFKKTSASFSSGLAEAAKQTVGDTLKLKGLREAASSTHKAYSGRYKDLLKTELGRADLGHAVAKSLPSAAVGTAYLAGARKFQKRMQEKDRESKQQYYSNM